MAKTASQSPTHQDPPDTRGARSRSAAPFRAAWRRPVVLLAGTAMATAGALTVLPTSPARAADQSVIRWSATWNGFTDPSGNTWTGRGTYVSSTNASDLPSTQDIAGTSDRYVYQTAIYGETAWKAAVTSPGTYKVRIYTTESFFTSAGQRVYDVTAEGHTMLSDVDVYALTGGRYIAYEPTFTVDVTDGELDLGFVNKANSAQFYAIQVWKTDDAASPSPSGSATTTATPTSTPTSVASTPSSTPTSATPTSATTSTTTPSSTPTVITTTPPPTPPKVTTGIFEHPYAADSLWNSRPVNPVLGTYQIPDTATGWWATAGGGNYGIAVEKATASDAPMVIRPLLDDKGKETSGVWDPNSMVNYPTVTLPHFPVNTLPPSGTDGSVAIFDETSGIIYSFWQLRHGTDGVWRAKQMDVEHVTGQGWGDPAQFFKGASAAGQSQLGGLIRKEEFQDTSALLYTHALVASLDNSGLKVGRDLGNGQYTVDYIFPATSGDGWGAKPTGQIPEGALLMLPADYNVDALPSRELRKIARTLQVYGAYVVDRNYGVPLTIGASNDYAYQLGDQPYDDPNLDDAGDWAKFAASGVGQAMDDIRKHVRMVVSESSFITSDGKTMAPPRPGYNVNLLSLRGGVSTPWVRTSGTGATGTYSSVDQLLHFTDAGVVQVRKGDTQVVQWATLHAGEKVKLTASATGGAALQFQLTCDGAVVRDSGVLTNNKSARFVWPSCSSPTMVVTAFSGSGNSTVGADLRRV